MKITNEMNVQEMGRMCKNFNDEIFDYAVENDLDLNNVVEFARQIINILFDDDLKEIE